MKRIHYISGTILILFIFLHLSNHLIAWYGATIHISIMEVLRQVYRHPIVESILLFAVCTQIFSGTKLVFLSRNQNNKHILNKLQEWSGLYLAVFFGIHVSAILIGRNVIQLDTNLYFGIAGIHSFPAALFFIPYYFLAILSVFIHLAGVHFRKMKVSILGLTPNLQARIIIIIGLIISVLTLLALTNRGRGFEIPEAFNLF